MARQTLRPFFIRLLVGLFVMAGFAVLAPAAGMEAAAAPLPTYGTAVVDGSTSEWNLAQDFFTNLCTAANCASKPVTSKGYLRYNCITQVMYVLVLDQPGHTSDVSPSDDWGAIGSVANKVYTGNSGNNGTPPDFQYVLSGATTIGYEASFSLAPGTYTINLHHEVDGGNTSGSDFVALSVSCTDWGDLPNSYNMTTSAQNGARHTISNELYMGTRVDGEADGQPSATAVGDDNNNVPDDEDGVASNPTVNTTSTNVKLSVSVLNNTGSNATLACWIDFNRDGDFNDAGERASATVSSSGSQQQILLTFTGFALPTTGTSYYRCRLANNSSEVTNPTGSAATGEVEDYTFTIFNHPTNAEIVSFTARGTASKAILKWTSGSEANVIGFNVWRSTRRPGGYVQRNAQLLSAKRLGELAGADYTFRDKKVKAGKVYFYKVEVVGSNGSLGFTDVVKVTTPAH